MKPFRSYIRFMCLATWGYLIVTNCASLDEELISSQSVLGGSSFSPLSWAGSVSGELENDYCQELLHLFSQRCATLVSCLVSSARPVKYCQNCYIEYDIFQAIHNNISNQMGPDNVSCHDSLMRMDRLMLLYNLYRSVHDIWDVSNCVQCLGQNQTGPTNTTLYFLDKLNQSQTCFEKFRKANQSDLCKVCRTPYKNLNELYSDMSSKSELCIDIEDAMNITWRMWSNIYNCSVPREEIVPVIAVSSFMLFLPLVFYCSNFLHSEQKKRKLIQPKRAKSSHSLMNIQDKFS